MTPNQIGITMHNLSDKIDSGNIFSRISKYKKKDTINTLSCKAMKNFAIQKQKRFSYFYQKIINQKV